RTLARLHAVCRPDTRLVLNFHSNVWRPALALATLAGRREPVADENWLSLTDVLGLLRLAGFEAVTATGRVLVPVEVPGLTQLANRVLAKLPGVDRACLAWFV